MYIKPNSIVYTSTMLFLIMVSPFAFYYWHKRKTSLLHAKRDAVITLMNVLLFGIIGSLLSAKINSLFDNCIAGMTSPKLLTFEGQRLYGGILLVLVYYLCFYGKNNLDILNSLALTICPLLSIGKLGCFFAGHTGCAGTLATNFGFWYYDVEQNGYTYLIPKQLIDSLFYFLLFIYLFIKNYKGNKTFSLTFEFVVGVGLYLFIIGFWSNEVYLIKPFRISQLYALLILCTGFFVKRFSKEQPLITTTL